MAITRDMFWQAIDLIDREAVRADPNNFNAMNAVSALLVAGTLAEIEAFEEQLSRVLYDIDGEEYCDAAGINSGDGFLYSRCYAVAMGREFYTEILSNPIVMPNAEYEPLLYVAAKAWAEKTGNAWPDWDYKPLVSYETGANAERWGPRPSVPLTPEHAAKQFELDYQRAMSSAVHAHRRKSFDYVIELLAPYEDRLSKKFLKILMDARSQEKSP